MNKTPPGRIETKPLDDLIANEEPKKREPSLMEMIKASSHTSVNQLAFDCPMMEFSPRPEVID